MIANVRRRAISWDKSVMANQVKLTTKRASWSLADLVQFRPAGIEPGHLAFGGSMLGNERGRFLGACDIETGLVQRLLQFRDAYLGHQDGGFHTVQFALLFETQLAWTRH